MISSGGNYIHPRGCPAAVRRRFAGAAAIIFFIAVVAGAGCGPKGIRLRGKLDSPEHHVRNGNALLAAGKVESAHREFRRAAEQAPAYAPAHVGLALVHGVRGEFEAGTAALKTAAENAADREETLSVNIAAMRLYILGKEALDRNWLERVERIFRKTTEMKPEYPATYFYMGVAYKLAYRWSRAKEMFTRVLTLRRGLEEQAIDEIQNIRTIRDSDPNTDLGKRLALQERITRAETSALFVAELSIGDKIDRVVSARPASLPTDAARHPLSSHIVNVLPFEINGLTVLSDGAFHPDQPVTRAEFAIMVEDILIRAAGDPEIGLKFQGRRSPFSDVRGDQPFFNAVMVANTRGIMKVRDLKKARFEPHALLTGAEAIAGIDVLRRQLEYSP